MKKVLTKFMACAFALFVVSCGDVQDSDSGQGGGNGQQGGGGSGGTVINIPESYGESVLPDLTKASGFAGQSYLRYDKDDKVTDEEDAVFFNTDGTFIVRDGIGRAGSSGGKLTYSFRQLKKILLWTYSYNPATQKLTAKLKGMFAGDRLVTKADDYVEYSLKATKQSAAVEGYTTISIPQEWIDAKKTKFTREISNFTKEFACSVSDGVLVLDDLKKDEGEYEYSENNVRFKLYLNDYDIRIENGDYELNEPVIYTMENGRFSGADFKWTAEGSVMVLKKLGDFEGTYEIEYGSCYAKLTSVTGDIPYAIKNMVGTEYELKPDKSDSTKIEYKPILKTINYTVIGSDDVVATDKAQAYISNPSVTAWTENTFKLLTSDYITGIYTNQECTRSVMGKEILDGARVYIKLKEGTAAQYNAYMENFTDGAGDGVTLTVQKKCKVTFNLNDGSGKTYVQEFTSGIPFEVNNNDLWSAFSYDDDGKTYFAGWATDRNASEAVYARSWKYCDTYTLTEDTMLYAVWKKIYSVIIKDPDGVCSDWVCKNTDGEYPVDYVYIGGDVNKPFYKDGYVVVGYAKNKNATEPDYIYCQKVPFSEFGTSTELVLYVVWRENRFLVSFETYNGSAIYSVKTDCIVKSPVSTKNNYELENWYTSSSFTGEPVVFPFYVTEPVTLYAKWKQIAFPVSFETNGGSFIDTITTELITEPPITSRKNYDFVGWFISSDFSGEPINFPYTVTDNIILYAKWIPNYLVEFETFGGTSISSFRARNLFSIENPEKEGFTFIEWYLDSSFNKKAVFPIVLTDDIKFYAKWKQNFSVKFETYGGSKIESVCDYIIYEPLTPSKENKSFAGWYSDESFVKESEVTFPYEPNEPVTLYARWDPIFLTITYDANGATDGFVPEITSIEKGCNYTISTNVGELKKFGYTFAGWSTSQNGDEKFDVGQSITPLTSVILYACWEVDYTTMIDVEGGKFNFGIDDEKPTIIVSDFKIAKYEVTYELWSVVYNWALNNGYCLTPITKGNTENDNFKSFIPATKITWDMACVWLNAYSEYTGYEPVYYRDNSVWRDDSNLSGIFYWDKSKNGYRLPTECEWEYAAIGGKNKDVYLYSGSNEHNSVANFGSELMPVGSKKTNALGIYDMSGNVAEWCYDYYGSFGSGVLSNPVHESESSIGRVIRGGSYLTDCHFYVLTRGCRDLEYWQINKNSIFGSNSFRYSNNGYGWTIGYNYHEGYIPYWALVELGIRPARN